MAEIIEADVLVVGGGGAAEATTGMIFPKQDDANWATNVIVRRRGDEFELIKEKL